MQAPLRRRFWKGRFELLHDILSSFLPCGRVVHAFGQIQPGEGLVKTWTTEAVRIRISKDTFDVSLEFRDGVREGLGVRVEFTALQ
jgi:hypothetical protein